MIYLNYGKKEEFFIDDSVYFAKALFETILIKERAVFLKEHLERINSSLEKLKINNRLDEKLLLEFLKREKIKNASLKVLVSDKNIILKLGKLNYEKSDYEKGFKLTISEVKRNSTSILTYLKSTAYIENILEREKAIEGGYNEVIFLNENNFITEGAISNLYFIKDNKIKTAKLEAGLLDGTIRKWVVKNFPVEEGFYRLEELLNSDAVFITNSLMGIMRVSKINNVEFKENEKLKEIEEKYRMVLEDF
ncbi:MAG: aminotransferase class IV [Sarcina sp.]